MSALLRRPDAALFIALAIMWGSSYIVIRLAGTELDPFSLVALRLVVGSVALAVAMVLVRPARPGLAVVRHFLVAGDRKSVV